MPLLFSTAGAGPVRAPPSGENPGRAERSFPRRPSGMRPRGQRCPGNPGRGERRTGTGGGGRNPGARQGASGSSGARGKSRRGGGSAGGRCRRGAGGSGAPGAPRVPRGLAGGAGSALRKPRSAASSRRRCGNSRLGAGLSPLAATPGRSALPARPAPGQQQEKRGSGILSLVLCLRRWRGGGSAPGQSSPSPLTSPVPVQVWKRNFLSKDLEQTKIFDHRDLSLSPANVYTLRVS